MTDFLKENWVAEACAPQDLLDAIFPETIHTPLGTWIGAMRALGAVDYRHTLKHLKVPTLVLWATQDNAFPETPDQEWVKGALETASRVSGTPVIYKTYGKKPLPETNIPLSDLGHNLQWAAPQAVASDISAFIATGSPTATWHYAHPDNVKQVLTEAGKGNILTWGIKEK